MSLKTLNLSQLSLAILPTCAINGTGGFCCAILTASNIARYIFGLMGALALGYFIFAGYKMITSAGEASKFKKGQDIMVNTVLGIVVIIIAWTAVNLLLVILISGDVNKTEIILTGATKQWYNVCNK